MSTEAFRYKIQDNVIDGPMGGRPDTRSPIYCMFVVEVSRFYLRAHRKPSPIRCFNN